MNFDDLFPDEREKGDSRMRQCQLVMLRMFKILDYLCTKHNIKYFLNGGTLLGAIRHQGFIPWDDDLDIGMTRENYEKFILYAAPELPVDIFFQNEETDPGFPKGHIIEAKLRDKYSSYSRKYRWQNGLQIDIAVFDRSYLPHNFFIYALNKFLIILIQNNNKIKRSSVIKWISKNSPVPLVYATSFINKLRSIKFGSYYIRHNEINSLIKTKFEGMDAWIPLGWNTFLKRRYGNFMKWPPVEKRQGHHSDDLPNPFKPCEHNEILHWENRKAI